jgi:hypothetical protein
MPKKKSKGASGIVTAIAEPTYKKIHLYLEEELYNKVWEIVKKRYVSPTRKFYLVVNEALREYITNHKQELEG